jgi:hypothetical protein
MASTFKKNVMEYSCYDAGYSSPPPDVDLDLSALHSWPKFSHFSRQLSDSSASSGYSSLYSEYDHDQEQITEQPYDTETSVESITEMGMIERQSSDTISSVSYGYRVTGKRTYASVVKSKPVLPSIAETHKRQKQNPRPYQSSRCEDIAEIHKRQKQNPRPYQSNCCEDIAEIHKRQKQNPRPYQSNCCEDFPGIEFSSHRSQAVVGHKSSTIRGNGIQLMLAPNLMRRYPVDISLQGCISGSFVLPEGVQLASPVFLVTCTPRCSFQQRIALLLNHFIHFQNHEQCKDMVLLTSPDKKIEDKDYVCWKFNISDQQPWCRPHVSYGKVQLAHSLSGFICFGIRQHQGKL